MTSRHSRPVRRPAEQLDHLLPANDPAETSRIAHATASALLARVREDPTDAVVERLVAFTGEHGIDTLAELWSQAPARTLPGALWRLYLLQLMIHEDPASAALLYERGRVARLSPDVVVAGVPTPAGPDELVSLIDTILRGLFRGDLAVALERAASFCRVQSAGALALADDHDATEPDRATALTTKALRLSTYAHDLSTCAWLWRRDALT